MIGIIPCAGKGVRFKELGKYYPKAMLPVDNKPILLHNINNMLKICDKVIVIVKHQKEKIIEVIKDIENVSWIEQKNFDGLSDAILQGINYINDTELLIVLGDVLANKLFYDENNYIIVKQVQDYSRWCMVSRDGKKFYDKPANRPDTNLAVSGVYKFNSSDEVKKLILQQKKDDVRINGEYQISYVLERLNSLNVYENNNIVDFGTLEEYLVNKNVCRDFNNITFKARSIIKSSNDRSKMLKESRWFDDTPLKDYTPNLIERNIHDSEFASYELERVFSPTLRDIFLYLDYSEETWTLIFTELFKYIRFESYYKTSSTSFLKNDYYKVLSRNVYNDSIVYKFLACYKDFTSNIDLQDTAMHGDFCFSNILYDLKFNTFKVIDPKGDVYGSYVYDLAKLMHSVLYPYDYIDADMYYFKNNKVVYYNDGTECIRELFKTLFLRNFDECIFHYCKLITASLYLSMIPLHSNKEHKQLFFNTFKSIANEVLK
jgi:dTDP-glucose pyrophosphorylase